MSEPVSPEIEALLQEHRSFPPSQTFAAQAIVNDPAVYARAAADPEAFWAGFATELEWITPWSKVLDWNPPDAKWFVDGKINVSCQLPRSSRQILAAQQGGVHLGGRAGRSPDADLLRPLSPGLPVCQRPEVSLGVKKGDRVALYMPLIPELAIAMLACARIGAVHSVVFGGFSAGVACATASTTPRARCWSRPTAAGGAARSCRSSRVADEALEGTPSIQHVVIVQRAARFAACRFMSRKAATTGITG